MMQECYSTQYFDEWAKDIRNAARRRAIIAAAGKIAAAAYEEKEASEAEDRARAILDTVITEDEQEALLSPKRQAEILRVYIESRKDAGSLLVRTGYPTLDLHCGGGLRRGDLIIVAARTSIGKSTYAENIAENVAKNGHRVLFVSVEMTPDQMLYRYAVRTGALSQSTLEFGITSDVEDEAVTALQEARTKLPFYIYDAPTATVAMIRAQMSRMAVQGPLGLVVVDYLQLLADAGGTGKDQKEHLRIGQITKALKHLAREYDVPIILISQLNRNLEYRGGEPKLADLRESGRIEEDADLVLMLWEVEQADTVGNVTRLKIAKNRQGPTEPLPIRFNKPTFTFVEPLG
jgi:replicative DNA helicase